MSSSSELASFELSSPLTDRLNDLLDRLRLPFVLDTPLDLTPSLLIAILESVLQSRLPVSSSIRESRSDAAKIQAMKIFLGVLATEAPKVEDPLLHLRRDQPQQTVSIVPYHLTGNTKSLTPRCSPCIVMLQKQRHGYWEMNACQIEWITDIRHGVFTK